MKTLLYGAVLTFAGLLAITSVANFDTASRPENAVNDEVVASFNRELTRQPGPLSPVKRESIDEDVLYKTMNAIHWTGEPANRLVAPEINPEKTHEAE